MKTTIKARRTYRTLDRGYGSEPVHVTGFAAVRVGIGAAERIEVWCRVRFSGERRARILMHPSNLIGD